MSLAVCVAGVGAVGGTLAARLTAGGATVNLLARGARAAALRRDGLRVACGTDSVTLHLPVREAPDCGVQDAVFVAAKSQDLPMLLPTLAPLLGPDTLLLPLVNGIPWWYFQGTAGPLADATVNSVDPEGALRRALPAARIIGCVVYVTARLHAGLVEVMGSQRLLMGDIVEPGATPAAIDPAHGTCARLAELAAVLNRGGMSAAVTGHIRAELWTKVALNLATNPLSVVAEATLYDQATDHRLLPLVTAVIEETQGLARAYGNDTPPLATLLARIRAAGHYQTSMLQDYLGGRPLEMAAIGRAALELAAKIGHDMPTTRLIIDLCTYRAEQRGAR